MMSNKLTDLLNLKNKDKVSIIGCGGKTSTMNLLAQENVDKKVLLTTTTKIYIPKNNYNALKLTKEECISHIPITGINVLGVEILGIKKLKSLEIDDLTLIQSRYDLLLMECDGSASLPLKGWKTTEPVIPSFTTHTLGIVTLKGLNKKANEENIHNLDIFLTLSNINKDTYINISHIKNMITNKNGMFKNSIGKKYLLINQIENNSDFLLATELVRQIKLDKNIYFDNIIYINSANSFKFLPFI